MTRPALLLPALLLAASLLPQPLRAQSALPPPTDAVEPVAGNAVAVSADEGVSSEQPVDADDIAPAAARPLQAFLATYAVFSKGRHLGEATLQLHSLGAARWRIDLDMSGRGLVRLTGLDVQLSTLFDSDGHDYRPLSQSVRRHMLFSTREVAGVYDWAAGQARWSGDLKPSQRAPVALRAGDMDGLLIDLALIRDAVPGKTLHYRYVERGRAREQTYEVAAEPESVEIDGLGYSAMRVAKVEDDGDQTMVWVAHGVPTPIRILQREDGADGTDLRLIQYQGTLQ